MEVQYEVRCGSTKRMHIEFMREVVYRTYTIVGLCISAVLLLLTAAYLARNNIPMALYSAGVAVYGIVWVIFAPRRRARIQKEGDIKLHGGDIEGVVRFGDEILYEKGSHSLRLAYAQINRVYYLQHTIVLLVDKAMAILVDPEAFPAGDLENFRSFLQIKCSNAKIHRR